MTTSQDWWPAELANVLETLESIGQAVQVPCTPGRTDASQAQTDARSFAVLEPTADGFRKYYAAGNRTSPAEMLVDRASLLTLTVPAMTVLVGGVSCAAVRRYS